MGGHLMKSLMRGSLSFEPEILMVARVGTYPILVSRLEHRDFELLLTSQTP